MILGNAQILTCPYCGIKKEVLSLISGYSVGAIYSDAKRHGFLEVSFVQKCNHCGNYFLMSRQKQEYGDKETREDGHLTYKEIKEAWSMLKDDESLTEIERQGILVMQVWAFNDDIYERYPDQIRISRRPPKVTIIPTRTIITKQALEEEKDYIRGIVDMLIEMDSLDNLLKAEFLRETGRFKEALDLLDNDIEKLIENTLKNIDYEPDYEYYEKWIDKIRKYALASDTRPFIVNKD